MSVLGTFQPAAPPPAVPSAPAAIPLCPSRQDRLRALVKTPPEVVERIRETRNAQARETGRPVASPAPREIHTKETLLHVERIPVEKHTHTIVEKAVPLGPVTVDLGLLLTEVRALAKVVGALQASVESLSHGTVKRRVIRDQDGLITGSVEERG